MIGDHINLSDLITEIKVKYGVLRESKTHWKSKNHIILVKDRYEAFEYLVAQIKSAGKSRAFFNIAVKEEIISGTMPPKKHCKDWKAWRKCAFGDLDLVIEKTYGDYENASEAKEENDADVVTVATYRPHDPSKYKDPNVIEVKDELDENVAALLGLKK